MSAYAGAETSCVERDVEQSIGDVEIFAIAGALALQADFTGAFLEFCFIINPQALVGHGFKVL